MRTVTDQQFETAYKNQDNKNIIRSVTNGYSGQLSKDEQGVCGMYGLWRCLQNHDERYGRKFTTSLFIHVDWECKRELSRINKKRMTPLGEQAENIEATIESSDIPEILEFLSEKQKNIVIQRFYENRTLEEIGQSQGYSKEAARQNINKIIKKLQTFVYEGGHFGV